MNKQTNKKIVFDQIQWNFVEKKKVLYITFILLCIITYPIQFNVIPATIAKLIKKLSSGNYPIKKKEGIFNNIINNLKTHNISGILIFLFILWIVVAGCLWGIETIKLNIFPDHLKHIRHIMFKKLIQRHKNEYNNIPSAESIQRVLECSKAIQYCENFTMSSIIPYGIGTIVVIGFALKSNITFGIITILCLAVVIVNCIIWGNIIEKSSNKREKLQLNMVEDMNNNFNNLMNVYINNKENDIISKNDKLNTQTSNEHKKEMINVRNSRTITTALAIISLLIIIIVGYHKVQNKNMKGIELATFITIYVIFIRGAIYLFQELPYFYQKLGIWKQSEQFVENLFIDKNNNRKNIKINSGSIQIKNVSFKYPTSDINVLNDISMNFENGKVYLIGGRSGSGKTTLMKLILQMYPITVGSIFIDGKDSNTISIQNIRETISYVNQSSILNNDSIINNMSFGNNKNKENIIQFLRKYSLSDVFTDIGGIEASAGYGGTNLSGGMKKIIFLVRSLLKNKDKTLVYIFDEPVTGLDEITRDNVFNMIDTECKGKTIIYISHNQHYFKNINIIPLKQNNTSPSPTVSK